MDLTVIRPLMLVPEADVIGFKNKYALPVCKNPCPVDGHTKREYVKILTKRLETENPGAKTRFFHAILEGNIPGWPSNTTESIPTHLSYLQEEFHEQTILSRAKRH